MSSNAQRRAVRREHEQLKDTLQEPVPETVPERQDVTVTPWTAAAAGGSGPEQDSED